MRLSVLALDYDGTISRDDTPDRSVREAVAVARGSGITVLLVTGGSSMTSAGLPAICTSSMA